MAGSSAPPPAPDPRVYTPAHLASKILRERAALEGERRTVTVLFADAVGFTPLAERLNEEKVYGLMRGCLGRMMDAVHRCEGTITQFRGDGVMALFGAPIAHEDSAGRAVAAALEMQASLERYAAEAAPADSIECRFRIGLNTGPVVVGRISDNLDMDYTAMGDTVNLAARMETLAEPGAVYLSQNTYRAVRDYFDCESLGELVVKGKTEAVAAFKALRAKAVHTRMEAAVQRGLTPYAGRERELSVLRDFFEQARIGRGHVVFVSGEAGIGKSRLLLEFRRSIQEKGAGWLEGHCASYGQNVPYLPVLDIVKRNFQVEETDSQARAIARVEEGAALWAGAARGAAPYLKYLLNLDPGDPAVLTMDSQARRAGIFDALRTLLHQESRRRPLVVVVEDLHWVDEESEKVLGALVDIVPSAPVLLVLTYRPGYRHSLGERAYYNRLALGSLPPAESAAVARSVVQAAALPEEIQQLITGKAEGNPFYIEEVTRALLESGLLQKNNGSYSLVGRAEQIHIPDTIQEIILSRIDRLARPARDAIQLASVIGREFTVRILERLSDLADQTSAQLAELKTLELIYEKSYYPELSYMFKHALVHDVAYSSLLHERRKALHLIVAAAIEELYVERLQDHYEMLAHHYSQAEVWTKALGYCVKAAQKAAAGFANKDALAYFDLALEVCDKLGDVALETFAQIHTGKAEIHFMISEWKAGAADCGRLRDLAHVAGNRRLEGLALTNLALNQFLAHEFDRAEAAAREALDISQQLNDAAIRASGTLVLGSLAAVRGQLGSASALLQEATRLCERTGLLPTEMYCRYMYSLTDSWRSLYEKAHRKINAALAAAGQYRATAAILWVHWTEGLITASEGRYSEAIAVLEQSIALSQRMGDRAAQSRALNTLGWVYGELCCWEKAAEFNREGLTLALALGDHEIIANARANLADCAAATGQRDDARRDLEELYAALPAYHEWMKWRYTQHVAHSLGELLLQAGEPDRALALANECLALAEPTESRKYIVKGHRLRGQVLLAQGKIAEAAAEIETAQAMARQIANPHQLWKTLVALGEVLEAQGDPQRARTAYTDALAVIEQVAARLAEEGLRNTLLSAQPVQALRRAVS